MDGTLVAAALLSALLHAAWNAAVKASARPPLAMTAQMLASALLAAPVLAWTGAPASAAWPWMAASTLFGMGAVASTLRAYEQGGFGMVYPLSRASSVLLVLPLAALLAGEWPRPLALLGVALVSAAVLLLARGDRSQGRTRPLSRPALRWTLTAAAFTAGYIACDAQGVRQAASPLAYGCTLAVANALLWTGWQCRQGLRLAELRPQWPRAWLLGAAAMLSYWLILWVWTHAPIAPASALRDTSAIFATLIAVFVLKEPPDRRVIAAVALACAGTLAIRLG
jgi:drug/metabolite transporter (DMT)-like permease